MEGVTLGPPRLPPTGHPGCRLSRQPLSVDLQGMHKLLGHEELTVPWKQERSGGHGKVTKVLELRGRAMVLSVGLRLFLEPETFLKVLECPLSLLGAQRAQPGTESPPPHPPPLQSGPHPQQILPHPQPAVPPWAQAHLLWGRVSQALWSSELHLWRAPAMLSPSRGQLSHSHWASRSMLNLSRSIFISFRSNSALMTTSNLQTRGKQRDR